MDPKAFVFSFAEYRVSEREMRVTRAGQVLALEPKAFRVLIYLLRNPSRLIPKDELLNAVWGETAVQENSLTRAVALLRKLLGDDIREPRFIATVHTGGYRFICPVEAVEDISGGADTEVQPVVRDGKDDGRRHRRLLLTLGAVSLVAILAYAYWYFARPLPRPSITAYTQITHDGHIGTIAGTDGSRIYFNMYPWGPAAQVGVTGGEIVTIPIASRQARIADVSADGASLLIWSLNPPELWTMGTVGGPPRLIQKSSSFTSPSWSPDTKRIAYADVNGKLFTMRSDGTDIRMLAAFKSYITDVAWSPDADRIRFTVDSSLWEINSTGGNLHPVLPVWKGPAGQCCGRWTPDGDFYVFLAGGNSTAGPAVGGLEQIWALDERHSFFRRVSPAPIQLASGPTRWDTLIPSRDGGKIFAIGTTSRGELVRFDHKAKELQPFLGGISAEHLAFSKDGSQLAYVTYPDGILWRAKADGTERVQLTAPPLYPMLCRWSPDGSQILFSAARSASRWGLYAVSAQGGAPRLLLPDDDGQGQIDGAWSPDGRRIAYQVEAHHSLRILDLDTGKVNQIPDSDGLWSPRWSPDGRYIAAMGTGTFLSIKLFDLQTQQWSTLTEDTGPWSYPTWSHDGKFVYAFNIRGKSSIQRISVPDGKLERIVDLSGVHLIGSTLVWFGLDPDDNPLTLRNNGTSDIYALALERK